MGSHALSHLKKGSISLPNLENCLPRRGGHAPSSPNGIQEHGPFRQRKLHSVEPSFVPVLHSLRVDTPPAISPNLRPSSGILPPLALLRSTHAHCQHYNSTWVGMTIVLVSQLRRAHHQSPPGGPSAQSSAPKLSRSAMRAPRTTPMLPLVLSTFLLSLAHAATAPGLDTWCTFAGFGQLPHNQSRSCGPSPAPRSACTVSAPCGSRLPQDPRAPSVLLNPAGPGA